MKKRFIMLFLAGIFLMSSNLITGNNVSAASNELAPGFYVDGDLHTSLDAFKKLNTTGKKKVLLTPDAYLSLGKELVKTEDVLFMNDDDLMNSMITAEQYFELIGKQPEPEPTPEFKVLSIE